MEYSNGKGVSDDLEFLGALARSKEPFVSVSLGFGGCRTRSFLLGGRELGGGD